MKDIDMLVGIFKKANIEFKFGLHGDLSEDWDELDDTYTTPSHYDYITVLDDDDCRVGFSFNKDGKLQSIKHLTWRLDG